MTKKGYGENQQLYSRMNQGFYILQYNILHITYYREIKSKVSEISIEEHTSDPQQNSSNKEGQGAHLRILLEIFTCSTN